MSAELTILLSTAIGIAFLHTLTGPDHYLPFIALSKSRGWSVSRTIVWTMVCGSGHVLGSILLGIAGGAIGWSMSSLELVESVRGGFAGWAMLVFGLAYLIYGLYRLRKNNLHKHFEVDELGDTYVYEHRDGVVAPRERHKVTPWVMFIIFLLGPCEPMIPLLYFPAAKQSLGIMIALVCVYTFFTLITMIAMVLLGYYGLKTIHFKGLEKYMHIIGAFTILICGTGMVFMEW